MNTAQQIQQLDSIGLSSQKIARRLGMSHVTVYRYLHRQNSEARLRGKAARGTTLTEGLEQQADIDRQLVRRIKGDRWQFVPAARELGLTVSEAMDRYNGLFCRGLRQFVYGERTGLPREPSDATEHLIDEGMPYRMAARLTGLMGGGS